MKGCEKLKIRHSVFYRCTLPFFQSQFSTPSKRQSEFSRDLRWGVKALQHYLKTTWWKWDCGSAILFWRMPTKEGITAGRDGWPVWWIEDDSIPLPTYKRTQRPMDLDLARQLASQMAC